MFVCAMRRGVCVCEYMYVCYVHVFLCVLCVCVCVVCVWAYVFLYGVVCVCMYYVHVYAYMPLVRVYACVVVCVYVCVESNIGDHLMLECRVAPPYWPLHSLQIFLVAMFPSFFCNASMFVHAYTLMSCKFS